MLCQNCNKRPATVHFTQVINDNKIEMYLCEQCAREKGQFSFETPMGINDFFSSLMGLGSFGNYKRQVPSGDVCNKCGMSYEEFLKSGKFGCSNCYEIYGNRLESILKRLHGNFTHQGKIPRKNFKEISNIKEIDRLKELLEKAIKEEEYEKAAEIRDRIKSLVSQQRGDNV